MVIKEIWFEKDQLFGKDEAGHVFSQSLVILPDIFQLIRVGGEQICDRIKTLFIQDRLIDPLHIGGRLRLQALHGLACAAKIQK